MEYNVFLTEHAHNDLKTIYEYIAYHLFAPENTSGMVKGIIETAKALNIFPNRNPIYHEEPWQSIEVRFAVYKKYIIFYKVNDDAQTVAVARIMYGGRDISNQLNESDFA